jgi:hypothetical protein
MITIHTICCTINKPFILPIRWIYVSYDSYNNQRLSPQTALNDCYSNGNELFFCEVGTEFLYVLNLDEVQYSYRRHFNSEARDTTWASPSGTGGGFNVTGTGFFFLYFDFLRSLPILQCLMLVFIFRASVKRGQRGKSSTLSTDIMFFSVIGEHQEGKVHTFFFFVNLQRFLQIFLLIVIEIILRNS